MFQQVVQTIAFFDEMTPESLVGAMFVALVLAVALVGAYHWMARRRSNASMLLICLVLLTNLTSMLSTVCLIQSRIPAVSMVGPSRGQRRGRFQFAYNHVTRPDADSGRRTSRPNSPANVEQH
jgi:hypothetical protein